MSWRVWILLPPVLRKLELQTQGWISLEPLSDRDTGTGRELRSPAFWFTVPKLVEEKTPVCVWI